MRNAERGTRNVLRPLRAAFSLDITPRASASPLRAFSALERTPRICVGALKVREVKTQGNALGIDTNKIAALKGRNNFRIPHSAFRVNTFLVLLALFVFLTLPANAAVRAYARLEPVAFFVERIGGPEVTVGTLVGAGQDPHTYEPTPKQLADVSASQLLFRSGLPFEERLVAKAQGTGLRIIDIRQNLTLREDEHHHDHEHQSQDPHVWLSLKNAKLIAQTVAEALTMIDPQHKDVYAQNLAALKADIDKLETEVANVLVPCKGKRFYVYHPGFGYLADEYGLIQMPVEVEGKEPSARQLAELIEQAKRDNVKIIFTEAQSPTRAVNVLASEIGAKVVQLNPLSRDYLNNFSDMVRKIAEGCTGGSSS